MKKLFFMVVAFFCVTTMNAQFTDSKIWADVGIGSVSGGDGLGLEAGLRWNKGLNSEYLSWDILKVKVQTDTDAFTEDLTLQALTGLRANTPVLFGQSSIYFAAGVGLGYMFDPSKMGIDWDASIGVNLNPNLSVGLAYNNQNIKVNGASGNYKITSIRVGFTF